MGTSTNWITPEGSHASEVSPRLLRQGDRASDISAAAVDITRALITPPIHYPLTAVRTR